MNTSKKPIKNIKDIFETIKENLDIKTDEELWPQLELSRGFFFDVKAGRKHLSPEKALKIASKAGLSAEAMLILLAREKASSDEEKGIWNRIIDGKGRIMDSTV